MFAYRDRRGSVELAFTDRHRGIGGGPARPGGLLDLASPGGPARPGAAEGPAGSQGSPGRRADGVRAVTGALTGSGSGPVPHTTVLMRQVHGADVVVVDAEALEELAATPPAADALVTRLAGVVLLARAADCVPVLLADDATGVVGAVHCGRRGLAAGVVPRALSSMRGLGATSVRAWVGPHVCGRCYEVPAQMREEVAALVPESASVTSWGTPALDLGAGVHAQLRAAGVVDAVDVDRCTMEDEDLFSYRREGAGSGRLGGLVWMRP